MSDFWFLSFADTALDGRIRNPIARIRRQAESMGVFGDRIRIWNENDLDADFRDKMKDHLIPGSRGYGYWCWKPQIILQLLREMKDGDVLLYTDAGCHLNPKGVQRLREYFDLAKKHGIVAFQSRRLNETSQNDFSQHFLTDGEWCKGDLLDYFGVRNNDRVTKTGQLGGTVFLVRKDTESARFFEEFKDVFVSHFELCDDSASRSSNLPNFRENRHDQSVFSLLGKKNGIFSLTSLEYDPMDGGDDWSCMLNYPIWAKHDKGGVRSLFPNWFKRVVHHMSGGLI